MINVHGILTIIALVQSVIGEIFIESDENEGIIWSQISEHSPKVREASWRMLLCKNDWKVKYSIDSNWSQTAIEAECFEKRDYARLDPTLQNTSLKQYADFTHRGGQDFPQRHICSAITSDSQRSMLICPAYARFAVLQFEQLIRRAIHGECMGIEIVMRVSIPRLLPSNGSGSGLLALGDRTEKLLCLVDDEQQDSRLNALYVVISLVSFPMDLITSAISGVIMKQMLQKEGVIAFAFHAAVLVCNGAIYFFNLFKSAGLKILYLMFYWLCYLPYMVTPSNNYIGMALFETILSAFGNFALISFIGVSNMLQTALAIDRALALGRPVWYITTVTVAHTRWSVALLCLGTFCILIVRMVILIQYQLFKLQRQLEFNLSLPIDVGEFDYGWNDYVRAKALSLQISAYLHWVLIIASNTIHIFACAYVVYKILSRRKALNKLVGQKKPQSSSSYLLICTSLMNTGTVSAMFIMTCTTSASFLSIMIGLCTSCGFYVHCGCCAKYREVFLKMLRMDKLISFLTSAGGHLLKKLKRRATSKKNNKITAGSNCLEMSADRGVEEPKTKPTVEL